MAKKKNNKRSIISFLIVIIILAIIIWTALDEYNDKSLEKNEKYKIKKIIYENLIQNNSVYENSIQNNTANEKQIGIDFNMVVENSNINNIGKNKDNKIIDRYKGYDVIAKLEIPRIELETYVLEDFSKEALNVSVTKFWGPNPNCIGNFCVAGHNFKNKNMFSKLKKLEVGDSIFLEDNSKGKQEYLVYKINTVFPDDVSCLSQETNGVREITLITCTTDSKKRIIINANEKPK